MNIVWQSALPPTLCAITTCVLYVLLSTAARVSTPDLSPAHDFALFAGAYLRVGMLTAALHPQITVENWFLVVQGMTGKLYVLSLIQIMCVAF